MNPYTVIIPSCTLANVKDSATSLWRAGRSPGVVIVANGELLAHAHALSFRWGVREWEKPFNFAACLNDAAAHLPKTEDLIFLNDDTRLLTPNGFDLLREAAYAHSECGLMFPSVTGCTGNKEQITQPGGGVRYAKRHVVPFIGVYIRRAVWDEIGPMDERYCLDYGVEDNDYCYRVTQAGYKLGIFDGCVLEHGVLPSSYRDGDGPKSFMQNAALFQQKHGVSVFDLP